jgi:hypothetical protein
MGSKKFNEEEGGTPNKGHRFGILLQLGSYYFADAVRTNEAGQIEFYCEHATNNRLGVTTPSGLLVDYSPVMTLSDFKKLPGQWEP